MHISAVEKAGLSSLNEGAKVSYEEMDNRGKTSAENRESDKINSVGSLVSEMERPQPSQQPGPSFQCAKSGGDDDRRPLSTYLAASRS